MIEGRGWPQLSSETRLVPIQGASPVGCSGLHPGPPRKESGPSLAESETHRVSKSNTLQKIQKLEEPVKLQPRDTNGQTQNGNHSLGKVTWSTDPPTTEGTKRARHRKGEGPSSPAGHIETP